MIKVFLYYLMTVVFCISVTGSAFGQSRQMYSWTDENGVVHFTDSRPEGQEVTVHDIPDSEPQADGSSKQQPESADETSLGQQRREELNQARQESRQAQDLKNAECTAMRAQVDALEPNRRVFFTNEEGETERMDDVERATRVAEAKAFIEQNCN